MTLHYVVHAVPPWLKQVWEGRDHHTIRVSEQAHKGLLILSVLHLALY